MSETAPHLWELDHPYYCNDANYFSNDSVAHHGSWQEFFDAEHDSDKDMNLVFRWDWRPGNSDWNSTAGDELHVYWMGQRKGFFRVSIVAVNKQDESMVRAWLRERFEHLLKLWSPVSGDGDRKELSEPAEVIQEPTKGKRRGTCECCSAESVPTSKYDRVHFEGGKERTVWMCDVCASTSIGAAFEYPSQYDSRLYQTLGYLTNEVLKRLPNLPVIEGHACDTYPSPDGGLVTWKQPIRRRT